MSKRAILEDGTVLEFEAGTPDEVIDRTVKAHIANPPNDSKLDAFLGGALKPVDNLARAASSIPVIGPAIDRASEAIGMPKAADAVAFNNARRANNTRTGWQIAGNIAGTLPTSRLPGGAFVQGAASGALLSDANDAGGLITDAVVGGVGNKLAGVASNALGNVIAPRVSAGARRLHNAGVLQTPGQILAGSKGVIGRAISKGEEALTSVPLLGDVINMARERGTESYNRALGERVMQSAGRSLPTRLQPGEGYVAALQRRVGREYDRLVPNLRGVFDADFANDLLTAKNAIDGVPDEMQNRFADTLLGVFQNRVDNGGRSISGQALKDAESKLTRLVRQYRTSADADQRLLGDGYAAARDALRNMVQRSNPQYAAELQGLNKAWAMLRPMREASNAAPDAVITPQRMFQASRASKGPRDPLVANAAARLANRTPDSGTARRALATMGTAQAASLGAAALVNPAFAIPAALSALYTKPGLQAVNKAVFAPRGPVAKTVSQALRATPALVPALGPVGLAGLLGRLGD